MSRSGSDGLCVRARAIGPVHILAHVCPLIGDTTRASGAREWYPCGWPSRTGILPAAVVVAATDLLQPQELEERMRDISSPTATALAEEVSNLLGPPDDRAIHVGLVRRHEPQIEVVGVLDSISGELPRLSDVVAEAAFLSASASCVDLGTSIDTSQARTIERVSVTIVVTLSQSAIVLVAEGWSMQGDCAIDHPIVEKLRKWASLGSSAAGAR